MLPERPLRIALLTHSINPRGGVVHCLELAEALTALGHSVSVHAPGPAGAGLFRDTRCAFQLIPEPRTRGGLRELVLSRISRFVDWFATPGHADFDVFHAHDGIGANALLELRERGRIPGYLRTVHHLEASYGDRVVDTLEARSIVHADRLLCVSPTWQRKLQIRFGLDAGIVGNGVNTVRFTPDRSTIDTRLRARLGLGDGPVFLAVGGIEARKNTVNTLRAFARLRQQLPNAQLVIAGGASLLDHGAYRREFDAALEDEGLADGNAVIVTGVVDDAEMPALYRLANVLVFASHVEGFGLAIIEAMACGTPVVVSRIAPFTDFLGKYDCLWADPIDPVSIANAMCQALMPGSRLHLAAAGRRVAIRHDWRSCAMRHLDAYTLPHTAVTRMELKHA